MSRVLDARGLAPPEPFAMTLEAIARLGPGQRLTLLLHREPFPLYGELERRGFLYRTTLGEDGTYAILIERAP